MEKKETEELDLSHWVIIHESPLLGWLGRLDPGFFQDGAYPELRQNLIGMTLTLRDALVIQTTQFPIPGRGGQVQMGIVTNVASPHQFTTESVLVSVQVRSVTLVGQLSAPDHRELHAKVVAARHAAIAKRVASAGIVAPGPGAPR